MRIALLSDVHANLVALDAVLNDINASGVDRTYCLGDLVGYGPDPGGVVGRMRDCGIPSVRGNHDRMGDARGRLGVRAHRSNRAQGDGAKSYAFTDRTLCAADRAWLAELPDSIRFEHRGLRFLLVHGSPRSVNEYVVPDGADDMLAELAFQANADVVCVGHVHVPFHRVVSTVSGPVHYVSSGSVGRSMDGDLRACWVEMALDDADPCGGPGPVLGQTVAVGGSAGAGPAGGLRVRIHRCAYDVESVAAAIVAVGLPPALADALRKA